MAIVNVKIFIVVGSEEIQNYVDEEEQIQDEIDDCQLRKLLILLESQHVRCNDA